MIPHGATSADYIIVVAYFMGITLFGVYFGRYAKGTSDYFFGGQRFAWWLIGFSSIATMVGSYSFVKYSEAGFSYGLSSSQSYLNDWFWVPILLIVWLPVLYYRRIQSVPEYFDLRFGRWARLAATGFMLVYLIGYIGVNLLTLGKAMQPLMGWSVMTGAAVTCALITAYVMAGGQTSVIMTDLLQGVILLIAGLALFAAGIWQAGGLTSFWAALPQDHRYLFSEWNRPDNFSFIGIYVQDGLANSAAFVLMNQGMIMRFLALRSIRDARKMAVLWILVLSPLAAIAVSGAG
ncbi:MAG TPA: sodium:solute symporter family protein, partial [Candidatus Hydrogenedentes bacterium]|nr:sodium:solute symporter family protein [Candidatus Hydrogenedentota bacterium]